jgi:hypothetical protein
MRRMGMRIGEYQILHISKLRPQTAALSILALSVHSFQTVPAIIIGYLADREMIILLSM